MTEFNKFLVSIGFKNLKNKTVKELEKLLTELYAYCNNKYNPVKGNYFTESWATNTSIKRGSEGLDIHHIPEYDPTNLEVCSLSHKETAMMWYDLGYIEYQLAKNLVYCNWIEHHAIHAVIDTLRTRLYGIYRPGCIESKRAPILNRFYNDPEGYISAVTSNEKFTSRDYFRAALTLIKDEVDTYMLIMDEWAAANDIDDWLVFGHETESLENCFDVIYE